MLVQLAVANSRGEWVASPEESRSTSLFIWQIVTAMYLVVGRGGISLTQIVKPPPGFVNPVNTYLEY
jgi:hypothetical protein